MKYQPVYSPAASPPMNHFRLMDMPLELFRAILSEAVKVRTLKRAMRLRLVSKFFDSEMMDALVASKVLDFIFEHHMDHAAPPIAPTYLEKRLLQLPIEGKSVLCAMQRAVKELVLSDGQGFSVETYKKYCSEVASLMRPWGPWSQTRGRLEAGQRDFKDYLLTAAAHTNKISLLRKLLSEHLGSKQSDEEVGGLCDAYIVATEAGHLEALDLILSSIRRKHEGVCTEYMYCLMNATRAGNYDTARFLLERYCTLGTTSMKGFMRTPCVRTLDLIKKRAYAGLGDSRIVTKGWSLTQHALLDYAIQMGWTEMAKHLISGGANDLRHSRFDSAHLSTVISGVCELGFEEMFTVLLEAGEKIDHVHLEVAARRGRFNLVVAILRLLSETNEHDELGESDIQGAIASAARSGYLETVRLLLNHRQAQGMTFSLDVASEEQCQPPIVSAVWKENEEMFHLLLQHGATLATPETGGAAVKVAEEEGLDSMLALLTQYGALNSG